jgi:hypothetical protein
MGARICVNRVRILSFSHTNSLSSIFSLLSSVVKITERTHHRASFPPHVKFMRYWEQFDEVTDMPGTDPAQGGLQGSSGNNFVALVRRFSVNLDPAPHQAKLSNLIQFCMGNTHVVDPGSRSYHSCILIVN